MDISMIGTGYVGLVSGACFADFGHTVTCVDTNQARLDALKSGNIPFYEPGLAELVEKNRRAGRLHFAGDVTEAVADSTVIFLAVGTPEGTGGAADISQVEAAVRGICKGIDGKYRVLVTKSTVPVGTGDRLRAIVREEAPADADVDIVSNPEFLREGSAVNDFMRPDRVVIGTSSSRAAAIMREIYRPLYLIETPVLITDVPTAEMIKCASNAFLSVKISFINEIANLCDQAGADVHAVARGMGLDKRIGPKFLHAGPGYGGSCFPKDTRALVALGSALGVPQRIVTSAIEVNEQQREVTFRKVNDALGGVAGRTIAVLGLAFKPNTSDVREAPALYLCRELVKRGAAVRACDPVANEEAAQWFGADAAKITFLTDAYDAAAGADALVIMTEWNEFRSLDLQVVRDAMKGRVLVDTRNVLDPASVSGMGFQYVCTGRQALAAGVVTA